MATKQSKKSAQTKKRVNTQKAYDPGKNGLSTPAKILIAFFAVLMALSLMIPSISAFFNQDSSNQTFTIDDLREAIDNQYSTTVETLETQLEADPTNPDLLHQLGEAYMQWAANSSYYAMTDEQTLASYDHAKKAEEYFATYLADNDDPDAAVDAAMCAYYYGETQTAQSKLEELIKDNPDQAGAYANLGMLYEIQGMTEEALDAYNTAIEKDPDDEQQAKSYAESRISALTATDEADDSASGDDTSAN